MTDSTASGSLTGPLPPDARDTGVHLTQLGRYRISKKLGVGGSAMVYLATDTTIDKKVALKVLHEHLRDDPVTVRRFANDARALARLNHPNIVQIYAAELDQYYFAMEFVEGTDLARLIADHGALPPGRAVAIVLQIADALAHIHRQGLVHRDVKPGNALIAPGDRVKMTDFSIARETDETMLTLKGSLVGTVEYMSPEQIREELSDARADVYALGAVLYELLAGRPPFAREGGSTDLWPLMERILKTPPRVLSELNPDVPVELSDVVQRALKKDPKDRFESMDDLISALRACMNSAKTVAVTPVALARPVELPDGTARLSWTASDDVDFDRYEIHASVDRDFVPSDDTRVESIPDRTRTETTLPSKSGSRYYRVKTVLRGGLTALSNRTMFEIGLKPPFWRRREFIWVSGAAILGLMVLTGIVLLRPPPPSGISPGREVVRARGKFNGAQYFPQTGRYRFTLMQPEFEVLDAGPISSSLQNRNTPRIAVDLSREVSSELDAAGVDLTLLLPQSVSVRGVLSEVQRQGLVLVPAVRTDLVFESTSPAIRDISPEDWKNHENKIVRLTAVVERVEVFQSNNTVIDLAGGVRVFLYSGIKTALEGRGVDVQKLAKKTVTVTGPVRNTERYGMEIIPGRPEHLNVPQ